MCRFLYCISWFIIKLPYAKRLLLPLLLTVFLPALETNAQKLYSNAISKGIIFNTPSLDQSNRPYIMLDDVNIDEALTDNGDSIFITKIKLQIAQNANAPAVKARLYYNMVNDNPTMPSNLVVGAPIFIQEIEVPANNSSHIVVTTLSAGDSANTLFKIKMPSYTYINGYKSFFLGLSFSNTSLDLGWLITKAQPASSNFDAYMQYDSSQNIYTPYYFGGSPKACFSIEVFGKVHKTLPISLISFNGNIQNNEAILYWKTATETNNKGFEIEKSVDGNNFSKLAFIEGHGTSTQQNEYSYTDIKLNGGDNYYRLKQIDNDGRINYSGIIKLNYHLSFAYKIYPNPIINEGWLQLSLAEKIKCFYSGDFTKRKNIKCNK